MEVALIDPSAYTPPYDHALASALAAAGADVELFTSRFAYAEVSASPTYVRREFFYRHARGAPASRLRQAMKLAEHPFDMRRLSRTVSPASIVHFQWLPVPALDRRLLPDRPIVLTAHDLLPREPRPGQVRAQRRLLGAVDAVIVHSQYGRRLLLERLGLPEEKINVVRHGAFTHLTELPGVPLPAELPDDGRPVVLFFGLLRPYKGIEVLLDAWSADADADADADAGEDAGAQLWIAGHPRMPLAPLRARAGAGVSFLPRFVSDPELGALFRRADLIVLPYTRTERFDQSGVLATALAFGKPVLASDIGGFSEVAATGAVRLTTPGDPRALGEALRELIGDPPARERMAAAARTAAAGPFSWPQAAEATLRVYRSVA